MSQYFPIQTATSCKLKWSWSSLYLNKGQTGSCHRAGFSNIPEQFDQFHNTDLKISHRNAMLQGQWPGDGCEYCKSIESSGGTSDRMFQNQIPGSYPPTLDQDPTQTVVDPTILEVFFSNTCNLGCVYCNGSLSSTIQMEDLAHSGPKIPNGEFAPSDNQYQEFVPKFWSWFEANSTKLQRFHILGGEPFLQKDLHRLLDYLETRDHPELEFNIVTNLSLNRRLLTPSLDRLAALKNNNKIKRIDLQVSIDAWDLSQQYVRYGLDLDVFDQNMNYIIDQSAYRIGLLSTVSSLSIHGFPALASKYLDWNTKQTIFWYMHLVLPSNSVFDPTIFDFETFEHSLQQTRALLPDQTWDDKRTIEVFDGIVAKLQSNCRTDVERQKALLSFLETNDHRRKSSWKETFPWLVEVFKKNHVVQ